MNRNKVIILFFLLLSLIFSTFLVKQSISIFPKARGKQANIVVDVAVQQGPLIPIWQALAQGGEEKYPFDYVLNEIVNLKPKYIRIDHIYDFYDVVEKKNGILIFHWSQLDKIVDQILMAGALPFFSLSYMPPAIAKNGDITASPENWLDWQTTIKETIEYYSGKNKRNLTDIIYEVWNEPDLFGNWKIGGTKNYQLLYKYAVLGANQAKNVNPFKIGGPGTTAPYQNWVDKFLNYVLTNKLRCDFYSWHRYSLNPEDFLNDVNEVDAWLFENAGYTLPKYLTEWGSVSENSPYHDQTFDAAHLVAVLKQLIQRIDLAFIFEIKDGADPEGKKYWGRWGLLTHEKAGLIERKPKYLALELLNRLSGTRISLKGEGDWITGFAAKKNQEVKIILTNFDHNDQHFEEVPLKVINLENGSYYYQETYLTNAARKSQEVVTNGSLNKKIPLPPNSVVLIEITPQ